mgnify:FL=1
MREHDWKGALEIDGIPVWASVNFTNETVDEVILNTKPPIDIGKFAADYGTYTIGANGKYFWTSLEEKIYQLAYERVHDGNIIGI